MEVSDGSGSSVSGIHTSGLVSGTTTQTLTTETKKQLLVLKLREKRVKWDASAVNNEFMGKKSSKRCCIFHKTKHFGESDSDESDSDIEEAEKDTSGIPPHLRHHA